MLSAVVLGNPPTAWYLKGPARIAYTPAPFLAAAMKTEQDTDTQDAADHTGLGGIGDKEKVLPDIFSVQFTGFSRQVIPEGLTKNPALGRASCSWHYLRRRFLVSNEMPTAKAFCRTAPSERLSLPPMRLAGVFCRAIALSVRRSLFDQSRRTFLLAPAIFDNRLLGTASCNTNIRYQPTNCETSFKNRQHFWLNMFLFCLLLNERAGVTDGD
jgi:hypothetical protein